jgi:hypothetical protein
MKDKIKLFNKTKAEVMFDDFVEKLKKVLNERHFFLRRLDIETFILHGKTFILDVKDIVVETVNNKNRLLNSERVLMNIQRDHKYKKLSFTKDNPDIHEMKELFETMCKTYENIQKHYKLDKYLNVGNKDPMTDLIYKEFRPECPYTFYELLESDVSRHTFAKHVSTNLWNK